MNTIRCWCPECHGKDHEVLPGRKKDLPRPDDTAGIDITGRYEEDQRLPQFTCQINQAGIHIEGWLQFVYVAQRGKVLGDKETSLPRQIYTLSGDLVDRNAGKFAITLFDDWSRYKGHQVGRGTLTKNSNARLALDVSLIPHAASTDLYEVRSALKPYPVGQKIPRLSAHAIARLPEPVQRELAPMETAPIPSVYVQELHEWFSPAVVRKLLREWLKHENEPPTTIRDPARRQLLADFHTYSRGFFDRFHPDLMPVLCWHVRRYLSRFRLDNEYSRTLLLYLEIAVTRTPQYGTSEFPLFGKDGLALQRTDFGETESRYEAVLDLMGPSFDIRLPVGGGVLGGTLVVKKTQPSGSTWTETFGIALGGLSVGVSAGTVIALRTTGPAITSADWKQDDFYGSVVLTDASIWAAWGEGRSKGSSTMTVYGRRIWGAALEFDFSGVSKIGGGGIGISGTTLYGRIFRLGTAKAPAARPESRVFPVRVITRSETHFDLGSAVLTPDGRTLIRRMCAQELFFLQSPYSELRVDAYTDRVDCARRNAELAQLRAGNSIQAIKDTLGKKFAVPHSQIRFNPYGEEPARNAGLADGAKAQEWRKVEVFLDGSGAVQLRDLID